IFMALVGLETGVLRDENQIIKWDREDRYVSDWNQDLTLKDAVKYSAVWYMKEVARVVGGEKVKYYIDKVNYGNRDTCGGMEDFWLSGKMRISQEQQINFLRSLYLEKLPFSKRSIQIVKKIILVDDSSDYKIHAKTGWGETGKLNIGWYVGWIEKSGQVYFFATNIETVKPDNDSFPKSRIAITKSILRDLKIIE
ncbi:MAG: penicillin-binding transpeptidase domain-containing protein, partial [Bacteroidota bacterium]